MGTCELITYSATIMSMNLSKTKILQPIQKKLGNTNIILVGMMGAGKTTVGKALASSLGKEFIDSDHEIQERTGVKISVIWFSIKFIIRNIQLVNEEI